MSSITHSRSSPRAAFVTGGSGFVGSHLIQSLVDSGWAVRALARSDESVSAVTRIGAKAIRGDLNETDALMTGMSGCEVAFHIAAHFKLWGDRSVFDLVNVAGTQAVVEAALASPGLRRVVGVSAAAVVMGPPKPMIGADETLPVRTLRFAPYSSSKAEGERLLLAANGRRAGFETIAIRPPLIWGVGMPTLDHMAEAVKAGRFQWVSGGEQPMSTCHVDNLCDAIILAADHGGGGQAYFVSDGRDGTLKRVISELLATRGVVPTDRTVSFRTAWLIAGIMGAAWRTLGLGGEPPITRQMLRLIGQPFTIRIDKARRELGYVPRVTWDAGLAEMA